MRKGHGFGLAAAVAVAMTVMVVSAWAQTAAPPANAGGTSGGAAPPNVVQQEMRELTLAMQVTLAAIANNTLDDIPPAIHRVHAARDLTEAALAKGQVKLPRNADKLPAFVRQDEAFHGELVKLVRAARAHDLPAATRQFGVVLNGCTACHAQYRF